MLHEGVDKREKGGSHVGGKPVRRSNMDFGSVVDAATSPDGYGLLRQPLASDAFWSSVALAVICSGTACSCCLQPFADVCRCSIKPEMEEGEESRYSVGNVQCLLVCHPALASLP